MKIIRKISQKRFSKIGEALGKLKQELNKIGLSKNKTDEIMYGVLTEKLKQK